MKTKSILITFLSPILFTSCISASKVNTTSTNKSGSFLFKKKGDVLNTKTLKKEISRSNIVVTNIDFYGTIEVSLKKENYEDITIEKTFQELDVYLIGDEKIEKPTSNIITETNSTSDYANSEVLKKAIFNIDGKTYQKKIGLNDAFHFTYSELKIGKKPVSFKAKKISVHLDDISQDITNDVLKQFEAYEKQMNRPEVKFSMSQCSVLNLFNVALVPEGYGKPIESKCIYVIDSLHAIVLQALPKGIIVTAAPELAYGPADFKSIYIEGAKNYTDGERPRTMYVTANGTFSYTNAFGALRTIRKFKFLDYYKE